MRNGMVSSFAAGEVRDKNKPFGEEGTGRDGFGLNLGEGSEQRAAGQRVGWGSIGILGQTYMDRLAEESCST